MQAYWIIRGGGSWILLNVTYIFIIYLFVDDDGKLCLEVGINRKLRFSYTGGDNVQILRSTTTVGSGADQNLALPVQRWMRLTDTLYGSKLLVQELFAGNPIEVKIHIGGLLMMYISSRYQCVHLRQYYVPMNQRMVKPTEHGVVMSISEFAYFVNHFDSFTTEIRKVNGTSPCYVLPGHNDSCLECYPMRLPRQRKSATCIGGGVGFMTYPLHTRFEST